MLVPILTLYLSPYILAGLVQPDYDVQDVGVVLGLFDKFKLKFNRSYATPEEALRRFQYFVQSLKKIQQLNKNNPLTVFDVNKFSDWSPEEKKSLSGLIAPGQLDPARCSVGVGPSSRDAPDALDWRDKNAVTPVQDQRNCLSCWAFSATGAVEGAHAIKHSQLLKLSEQQLVDCDDQSRGCLGGLMHLGLSELVEEGGQETEDTYPYRAVHMVCSFNKTSVKARVTACTLHQPIDEEQMKELVASKGPLAIGVNFVALGDYSKGVLQDCDRRDINHGALLVGYGEEAGTPYWLIKNSWGADWGEGGYAKVQRGTNCIGIGSYVTYADVA